MFIWVYVTGTVFGHGGPCHLLRTRARTGRVSQSPNQHGQTNHEHERGLVDAAGVLVAFQARERR